jgi:hypothetical protein
VCTARCPLLRHDSDNRIVSLGIQQRTVMPVRTNPLLLAGGHRDSRETVARARHWPIGGTIVTEPGAAGILLSPHVRSTIPNEPLPRSGGAFFLTIDAGYANCIL